jgi:hypothetical protein
MIKIILVLMLFVVKTIFLSIKGGFVNMSRKWPKTAEKRLKMIKIVYCCGFLKAS